MKCVELFVVRIEGLQDGLARPRVKATQVAVLVASKQARGIAGAVHCRPLGVLIEHHALKHAFLDVQSPDGAVIAGSEKLCR